MTLSAELKDLETIESKFNELSSKYAQLNSNHDNLQNSYKDLSSKFEEINARYSQYDKEFNRFEYWIREASRRIPESNLKVLAELLIRNHVEMVATRGKIGVEYAEDQTIPTLKKQSPILLNLGYTQNEVNDFEAEVIEGILNEHPYLKLNGKNE